MGPRAVTLVGYAVIAAALIGYELTGLLTRRTPTLGDTIAATSRSKAARWVTLVAWLWLGWHLFARTD